MPAPGELQAAGGAASGDSNNQQSQKTSKFASSRPAGLDSSGADLDAIDGYLQQLLPALAEAVDRTAVPEGTPPSLASLGLDRAALLARGVPQHSINALYRSMAAHAGAFRKLVAGEVQQLQQLLSQQAGPQLQSTIQLLDGPIASSAAHQTLASGRAQAMKQSLQQQQERQQQVLTATAAEYISAAEKGLGPTADDLVKDYADAYASMKETMEVRVRHEQRRGDFLQNKLQQTEGSLRDTTAQLDAANRRISEQRADINQLTAQIAGLQSDLAASHAAHLALQQHHKETMEQAAAERQQMEDLHKKTVETLQADLTAAGGAAAALAEASRQVEALRLLYNEELSRASRLAVELSRATAAADKAAAEEDNWRRQLSKSDDRADNAEGMAEAMKVTVSQLEQELQQEKARLEAKKEEAAKLRLTLESSRLAAVEQRAIAQQTVLELYNKVETLTTDLAAKQGNWNTTENNLKLKFMELDGANAQLQASRTHIKQLMSDLETEQEKSSSLGNVLTEMKQQAEELTAAKEIAEGRLKTVQIQLSKANDSSAMMSEQLNELRATLEEQTTEISELQNNLQEEQAAHAAVREQATWLKVQVAELQVVEQQYGQLRVQHEETTAKLDRLQEEHMELTAKARQLELTSGELQQLQEDHAALKSKLERVQQKLQDTNSNLGEVEESRQRSEAQVMLLQDKLEHVDVEFKQLSRQFLAASNAGESAQHQVDTLSHQLESLQSALDTAEADRQALAAQRDGWMASFQEAYGRLQEWKAASQAASQKLAGRASIIQTAMQHLSSELSAETEASDNQLTSGRTSLMGSRSSFIASTSGDGSAEAAGHEAANAAESAGTAGAPAAARVSVTTSKVLDDMAALQQLMQAEAAKHQEQFGDTLEALAQRVQERSQAAQTWWQESMAAAHKRKAARAAAAAAKKKHSLSAMAAAQRVSQAGGSLSAQQSLQMLPHLPQQHQQWGAAISSPRLMQLDEDPSGADVDSGAAVGHAEASGTQIAMQLAPGPTVNPGQQGVVDAEPLQEPPTDAIDAVTGATVDSGLAGSDAESLGTPAGVQDQASQQGQQRMQHRVLPQHAAVEQHAQQVSSARQLHMQQKQQQQQPQHNPAYEQLLQQHRLLQQQHQMLLQRVQQHQQQQHMSLQRSQPQMQVQSAQAQQQILPQQVQTAQQQQIQQPQLVAPGLAPDAAPVPGHAETVAAPSSPAYLPDLPSAAQQVVAAAAALQPSSSLQQISQQLVSSTTTTTTTTTVRTLTSSPSSSGMRPGRDVTARDSPGDVAGAAYAGAVAATTSSTSSSSYQAAHVFSSTGGASAVASAAYGAPSYQSEPSSDWQLDAVAGVSYANAGPSMPGVSPNSSFVGSIAESGTPDSQVLADAQSQQHPKLQQQQQPASGLSGHTQHTALASDTAAPVAHGASSSTWSDQGGDQGLTEQQSAWHAQQSSSLVPSNLEPSRRALSSGFNSSQAISAQNRQLSAAGSGQWLPQALAASSLEPSHSVLTLGFNQSYAVFNQQTPAAPFSQGPLDQNRQSAVSLLSGFSQSQLQASPSLAMLESPGSSSAGSLPGGGYMSGYVSMVAYQEQMKSVAALHSHVGELAVQLREAHADAEGAQQQLQQERQEATTRTTALRGALGQLSGQMQELRVEHEALQQAHRQLVAKDLMNSGILKDRYVADLFTRLQEAEWKLDTARRRACTWGFDMMVPLGRVDRAIQTQYAEVWAAGQQQQQGLALGSPSQASIQRRLQQGASSTAPRPLSGGSSRRVHLDPLPDAAAGLSATVSTAAVGAAGVPVVGSAGSPNGSSSSSSIQRKKAAFTQRHSSKEQLQDSSSSSSSSKRPASAQDADHNSSAADLAGAAAYSAAEQLVAAGNVELLPAPALLQLIASLYSAKAAADATALRSRSPAMGLWEFVLKHLQKQSSSSGGQAAGSIVKGSGKGIYEGSNAVTVLAQLLGSVQQHAGSSKEIAQFAQALGDSRQQALLVSQARASSTAVGSPLRAARRSSSSSRQGDDPVDSNGAVVVKGSWGEVRLDNNKLLPVLPDPLLLLPGGLPDLIERILLWPGMMALLGWVAQGHFLVGLQEGSLGRVLMDVQAPHVHFLLLEAADILGLHPLPRLQVVQAAAPFVRLLRVPRLQLPPTAAIVAKIGSQSRQHQEQQRQKLTWQQDSLLVLSSAALQLLKPAELQAAMAAALVPAVLSGGRDDGNAASFSASRPPPPGLELLCPGSTPGLGELATLASLLALQPTYLLSHLPPEMHAMGGALAAALQAADRVVAVAGDRGSLLVCQNMDAALAALVKTAKGASNSDNMGVQGSAESSTEGSVQEWLQRRLDAAISGEQPCIEQLLPQHESLQQTFSSSSGKRSSGEVQQLEDDRVLLLRLDQLVSWSESELYKQIMVAAKPLRRVVPPGRKPLSA